MRAYRDRRRRLRDDARSGPAAAIAETIARAKELQAARIASLLLDLFVTRDADFTSASGPVKPPRGQIFQTTESSRETMKISRKTHVVRLRMLRKKFPKREQPRVEIVFREAVARRRQPLVHDLTLDLATSCGAPGRGGELCAIRKSANVNMALGPLSKTSALVKLAGRRI